VTVPHNPFDPSGVAANASATPLGSWPTRHAGFRGVREDATLGYWLGCLRHPDRYCN